MVLNSLLEEIGHPTTCGVGVGDSFSVTSAITSTVGFDATVDFFLEENAVGKVFCGIACGMAGDEFCFTAKEGMSCVCLDQCH